MSLTAKLEGEGTQSWVSFPFRVKHWQWITFFVLVALALRLTLALTHAPHLGIDGGAYLLSALDVQGRDITNVGFSRPPLAPGWLLVPFIELLGMDNGLKVWNVLFSFLPFLPVYLLARDLVSKSAAVFAVAFFSVDVMQMEMMVTGSLPLIGFSLIGMAIWAIFNLADGFTKRHWLTLALSVGLLPYINQTAAGIGAIVLPIITVSAFYFVRREKGSMLAGPYQVSIVFNVLSAAFVGILIGAGSLPWYLANMPGNSELRFPGPLLIPVSIGDPALLLQFPIVLAIVYFIHKYTHDYRVWAIGLTMMVLGVMILFLSYDEAIINLLFRPRYFLAILAYPAVTYLYCRQWPLQPHEWKEITGIVAVWVFLLWAQTFFFDHQTQFKDMVYPETVIALDIAKAEHPNQAIITNAYSLSHWVAALNQVESPNTWSLEPSPYYKATDLSVRCLLGWVDGCDAQLSAQHLNARYILIDERFPDDIEGAPVYGRLSDDEWANLPEVPWLHLRHAEGAVKLWEIRF